MFAINLFAIHKPFSRVQTPIAFGTAIATFLVGSAVGQKPQQPNPLAPKPAAKAEQPSPVPSGSHELTAADLEAFLDGIMPLQLAR